MRLGLLEVFSARLLLNWIGPWQADLVVDSGRAAFPSGRQTLTLPSTTLSGTVDPRGSSFLGEKWRVRLVGGAGAWGNVVKRRYFGNDASAGVSSTEVFDATASEVGETGSDEAPISYGSSYTRPAGRASSILDGRDWYVDGAGVTHVGTWPTLTPPAETTILHYDPENRRAEFASDTIVWPGTVFSGDVRFETLTARDVEMNFDATGARGVLWHATNDVGRLAADLEAMIRGFGGDPFAKTYRYRVVKQESDGRVRLQAVNPDAGMPDTLPIPVWPGIPGYSATWTGAQQGLIVIVQFIEGDRTLPRVVGFDGRAPTTATIDAFQTIALGVNATSYAAKADRVDAELQKIQTTLGTATAPSGGGAVTYGTPYVPATVKASKVKVE